MIHQINELNIKINEFNNIFDDICNKDSQYIELINILSNALPKSDVLIYSPYENKFFSNCDANPDIIELNIKFAIISDKKDKFATEPTATEFIFRYVVPELNILVTCVFSKEYLSVNNLSLLS